MGQPSGHPGGKIRITPTTKPPGPRPAAWRARRERAERQSVRGRSVLPAPASAVAAGGLGGAQRDPWIKTTFINTFIRRFGVDLSEAEIEDPDRFENFNAFFTRALKDGARPIAEDRDALACPADGTVSQRGRLRGGDLFQAKGRHYSAFELLGGDGALAGEFSNGEFATVYLSPKDYHRVHMPCTGTLRKPSTYPDGCSR